MKHVHSKKLCMQLTFLKNDAQLCIHKYMNTIASSRMIPEPLPSGLYALVQSLPLEYELEPRVSLLQQNMGKASKCHL